MEPGWDPIQPGFRRLTTAAARWETKPTVSLNDQAEFLNAVRRSATQRCAYTLASTLSAKPSRSAAPHENNSGKAQL